MRLLSIAVAASVLWHAGIATADTIHLYRFEGGSGFLADSAGAADLTPFSVGQFFPAATGRGSSFPTWDGGNASGLDVFSSGRAYAAASPVTGDFTAEAFVHFDSLAGSYGAHIVGFANSGAAEFISWTLQARFDGTGGTQAGELILAVFDTSFAGEVVGSDVVMEAGKDYYIGVSFDLAGGEVVFYVQNLTDSGALQVITRSHATPDLNPIGYLGVGGFPGSSLLSVDGLVDEVRISDAVLAQQDLLVNLAQPPIPEPATSLLLLSGLVGLAVSGTRRRR